MTAKSYEYIMDLITKREIEKAWYALNSSPLSKIETLSILDKLASLNVGSKKNLFIDLINCWKSNNM